MSTASRGRGYTGRHHLREEALRPGDVPPSGDTPKPEPANVDVARIEGAMRPSEPKHEPVKRALSSGNSTASDFKEEPRVCADDEQVLKELLNVDEQYRPVLTQLEQFCPGEDGIVFNRKLRELEATLTALCQDDSQLQQAFSTLHAAALTNPATARKLATAGASFTRQQRQNVLRITLLNMMQSTYSKLDVLERANPQILINAANLMGDYFGEARLANGSRVLVLCPALLKYMRSLLASNDHRAHRSLATQLMLNGHELLNTNAQELEELSISIRIRLLSPPPASIIWLLLSADLCLNKFQVLPDSLQQFYASHLELTKEEPPQNYSEVQYGSWKEEKKEWKSTEVADEQSDKVETNLNISLDENGVRKLRPILGAGAALTRHNHSFTDNPVVQDSYDGWGKTSLSKRYDLNSWRQQDNDEDTESDGQSLVCDKFIPSQSFVPNDKAYSDKYGQGQGLTQYQTQGSVPQSSVTQNEKFNQYGQKYGDGKYVTQFQAERYVTQSAPPPPLGDGKFNQPPPSVDVKFHQPPPSVDGKFHQPPPSVDGNFSQPPPPLEGKYHKSSPPSDATFHQSSPPVDGKFHSERPQNHFAEKNFPNSERPRRPPENWRKEKNAPEDPNRNRPRRIEWGRQRSKESDDASVEAENDKVGYRDGSGDAKPFRNNRPARESRPNQRQVRSGKKEEEVNEEEIKPPVRRHVTEVPRSHKYWDHDDRLDKDYNS